MSLAMQNPHSHDISFALLKKNTLNLIRVLDPRSCQFLQAYIRKENNEHYYRAVLSLLKEAHEREAWFACSCYSQLSQRALFAVRRLATNHLTLVRMTQRGNHHPLCPLWQALPHEKKVFAPDGSRKGWNSKTPLLLYPRHEIGLSVSAHQNKDSKPPKDRSNTPKLGRILYTVLENASVQRFPALGDYYELQQNLQNAFISMGYDFPTLDMNLVYFSPKQIGFAGLKLKKIESQWPFKHSRPFAFFLLKVDYFEGKTAYCYFKSELVPIEIQNTLRFSSGRVSPALGPFWLLLSVTSSSEKPNYYVPYNGFAIPIYSKEVAIAVESHFERRVLEKLIQVQKHLKAKHSVEFFIHKPLLDKEVIFQQESYFCRPDFVLKCFSPRKHFIILEVMGSHDAAYVERKLRLKPIFSSLGTWVEFDALTTDIEGSWNEKLDELARQIYKLFLNTGI